VLFRVASATDLKQDDDDSRFDLRFHHCEPGFGTKQDGHDYAERQAPHESTWKLCTRFFHARQCSCEFAGTNQRTRVSIFMCCLLSCQLKL
jgi:hypothetical protein